MVNKATKGVLEQAARQCEEHGCKLTDKRKVVLTGLLESEKALSAYELADFCRAKLGADLLPMSVYRILDFLEGEKLVHRLNLANKYVACAHIVCDHDHESPQFLICKVCSQVQEVTLPVEAVQDITRTIESSGFQLASNQIELDCVCSECA